MSITEIIILMFFIGTLCIVCFFVGAKVGQKVVNGEEIKLPELNPVKVYREHQEQKAVDADQYRSNIILNNIENYHGTAIGQEDVP